MFAPRRKHQQRLSLGVYAAAVIEQDIAQFLSERRSAGLSRNGNGDAVRLEEFLHPFELCTFARAIDAFEADEAAFTH